MPSSRELRGRRVLVTRPAHQAEPLCRLIEARGGQAIRLPSLAIESLANEAVTRAALEGLEHYQWLIFVSPNAVQLGLEAIKARGGLPTGIRLATVGKGSARSLRERLGREPDRVPDEHFDSEGLLALADFQQMQGQRVLILRGDEGRPLLGETLRQRGAEVDYLALYRRVLPPLPPTLDAWPQNTDIITVTSGEGLRNLCQLTPPAQQARMFSLPLVVVSERTAALAVELGFTLPARVAHQASDEAIVDSLIEWASTAESEYDRHG